MWMARTRFVHYRPRVKTNSRPATLAFISPPRAPVPKLIELFIPSMICAAPGLYLGKMDGLEIEHCNVGSCYSQLRGLISNQGLLGFQLWLTHNVTDVSGRIWSTREPQLVCEICAFLSDSRCLIALFIASAFVYIIYRERRKSNLTLWGRRQNKRTFSIDTRWQPRVWETDS